MDKELFYFGWVSSNIASNCYQWSTDKGIGTQEEAETFYLETREQHEEDRQEWFCYPVETI
jgi:hypothetical protein